MGTTMICCPNTRRMISTGKVVASAVAFRSMAVFLAEPTVRTAELSMSGSQKTDGSASRILRF